MKREDFIFTIGFQGDTAIIDKRAKRRYGKMSSSELVEKGMFRAAFCAALFDADDTGMQDLIERYNVDNNESYRSADQLKRLFGVDLVPEGVSRVKEL